MERRGGVVVVVEPVLADGMTVERHFVPTGSVTCIPAACREMTGMSS